MLSTIPSFLTLKKASGNRDSSQLMNRYDVLTRLFYLINNLSKDQQYIIFKNLLKSSATNFLLKLIIDMTDEQRLILMRHLETISKTERTDRRRYDRKDCLVNVDIAVNGMKYNSYVLDISPHGMFIETSESFLVGQVMDLAMTLPNYRRPLNITAEVIWTASNGIGVKFIPLSRQQAAIIKAFATNKEAVYEIVS